MVWFNRILFVCITFSRETIRNQLGSMTQKHQRMAKIPPRSKESRGAHPKKLVGNGTWPIPWGAKRSRLAGVGQQPRIVLFPWCSVILVLIVTPSRMPSLYIFSARGRKVRELFKRMSMHRCNKRCIGVYLHNADSLLFCNLFLQEDEDRTWECDVTSIMKQKMQLEIAWYCILCFLILYSLVIAVVDIEW